MSGEIRLIYGCDFREWVRKRIARVLYPYGPSVSIGVGDDQRLLAAVVYSDYSGRSLQCSIAAESPRWCSRRTLKALFRYPFEDCGCSRISVLVASDNARSLSLCSRLGFKIEGCMRDFYDEGIHLMMLGMLRKECVWVE